MTYDILNNATKADLIAWLRDNVPLPDISDEQFLQDIQIYSARRLAEHNKRMAQLSSQLSALIKKKNECSRLLDATHNPLEQMRLMALHDECSKEYSRVLHEIRTLQLSLESHPSEHPQRLKETGTRRAIAGNILTPNKEARRALVCHQVNCKGVMGAGLAKQIKKAYPDLFSLYKHKCNQIQDGFGGLGDVLYYSAIDDAGYVIANIFGQDDYGTDKRYTDYAALEKAFTSIAADISGYTVRIPYQMGCGLGGGDWNEVLRIIDSTLVSKGIDVEIWQIPYRTTNN